MSGNTRGARRTVGIDAPPSPWLTKQALAEMVSVDAGSRCEPVVYPITRRSTRAM